MDKRDTFKMAFDANTKAYIAALYFTHVVFLLHCIFLFVLFIQASIWCDYSAKAKIKDNKNRPSINQVPIKNPELHDKLFNDVIMY